MKRVRQAEAALQINDWLATPGATPPCALEQLTVKATRNPMKLHGDDLKGPNRDYAAEVVASRPGRNG